MKWTGKIVGAALGLLLGRSALGALLGALVGHLFDSASGGGATAGAPHGAQAVSASFFRTTFELMGHVAKSDGRVSEAEIDAARQIMQEFQLKDAQIQTAIAHFTRGKAADYDYEAAVMDLRRCCAGRPELLRIFVEIQLRAALAGTDLRGPPRQLLERVAAMLGCNALEFARIEALLRLRSTGGPQGQPLASRRMSAEQAYEMLAIEPSASDATLSKAYRRQLSRHHPDKLQANGLPESMLEAAKQKTQQIIEAYEVLREQRGMRP